MSAPFPDRLFEGKTALVTGATRGIGQAIADRLAELGATVYGTSRTRLGAESVADRYGTLPIAMDVGQSASVSAGLDVVRRNGVVVDFVVNNAGINMPEPATEVTVPTWDSIFDVNTRGTFEVSTGIARDWIDSGRPGAIVNVASQAGLVAIENRAAYGASKAAVLQLTRNLALEWAAYGIRVNAIAPTFVPTGLTSTLDESATSSELVGRIPMGRFAEPDEVAGPVAFLLSDAAAMITGHTLVVDGGYTIR